MSTSTTMKKMNVKKHLNHATALPSRTDLPSCVICGAEDIRVDYFDGDEPLELGECPRCSHRWTRSMLVFPQQRDVPNAAVRLLEDVRGLPHAA